MSSTTKTYTIKNPTLDGEPAGPHLDNYLDYEAGDIVSITAEGRLFGGADPDVVVIKGFHTGMGEQEIDRSSLVEIVEAAA